MHSLRPFLVVDAPIELIGTVLLTSALTALLIGFALPWCVNDEAGMRLLRLHGRPHGRVPGRRLLRVMLPIGLALGYLASACLLPDRDTVTGAAAHADPGAFGLAGVLGLVAGASGWLFWIDVRIHRLPDRIVLPLAGACAVLTARDWAVGVPGARTALLGGLVLLLALFLLALLGLFLRGGGMGLGDVKLGFPLGLVAAWISPAHVFLAVVLMHVSAVLVVVSALVRRRAHRGTRIAFGPHMLVGLWATILLVPVFPGI